MSRKNQSIFTLSTAMTMAFVMSGGSAYGQTQPAALPNPYRAVENWAKLPEGRAWGVVSGVAIDSKGNIWAFERCGADSCAKSNSAPVLEFDSTGKLLKSFGAGMFAFPHGIFVDANDNLWVADAKGEAGKGHLVVEFSPEGKVLLTLGKVGVTGDGPDTFNRPSGVVVGSNGDIFVADGHGRESNARIVKFSRDGKFIKAWGMKGSGPGEFETLHAIAMDSKGRIFVADRGNKRIQIFDANGTFVQQWTQFGTPSAIYIDKEDRIYVADSTDGIHIGNIKDGVASMLIPGGSEGVAADRKGNVYVALMNGVNKFVKP